MAEAEDLRARLARQHSRIDAEKQLGVRPAEAEDVDLPAAEYARNFYITIAVCVYVCAFQGICAFTLGGREGNASNAPFLAHLLDNVVRDGIRCSRFVSGRTPGREAYARLGEQPSYTSTSPVPGIPRGGRLPGFLSRSVRGLLSLVQ
jgi:hypothetical protein